jgi:uncharacterized membrane protein
MRRLVILAALLVGALAPAAALHSSAISRDASASHAPQLVAFRGHFGGFHLGGGGFGRPRAGYGRLGRRGSHRVVRRVVHGLAFAYFLHLFFGSGGVSLLFWLLVIGLVVHMLRRRRRRYSY